MSRGGWILWSRSERSSLRRPSATSSGARPGAVGRPHTGILRLPSFCIANYIDLKSPSNPFDLFESHQVWPCSPSSPASLSTLFGLFLLLPSSCPPPCPPRAEEPKTLVIIVPLENSVSFRQEVVRLVWMLAKRAKRANGANASLFPACRLDEGHADQQRQGLDILVLVGECQT